MSFKVGEFVVHPAHGVGKIVRLEEKQFSAAPAQMYYVVVTPKSTIWVPLAMQNAIGLRGITAKNELARYRTLLKGPAGSLKPDRHQRQLELSDRLKKGSFSAICEVVRDLTAHSWRKALGESDTVVLRRARDYLCQEWAAASGLSISEASQEIESLLLEGRKTVAS
jgi:CarD family transcriptional regulator